MPDDVTPVEGAEGTPTPTPSTPAVRNVGFDTDSWNSIFKETADELGLDPDTLDPVDEPTPEPTPEATTEEPKEDDKPAEGEEPEEGDEPKSDDEPDKGEDVIEAKEGAEVPTGEDAPAAEKTVAESVLELLRDKDTLDAAIRQAGVDTINDLPLVKELLGRERQSAEDRVKSELAKQAWTQQQVTEVQAKGQKAADELFASIEKLQEEIANDEDGTAELHVPTKDFMAERMKEYADGQVNAYHNSTWGELADLIYSLPELTNSTPEVKAELAKFQGAPPRVWLQAHLEASRQNLWNMAQAQLVEGAKSAIADERKTIEAAHKLELEKLTAKQAKEIAKAVEEAKKEARATALAELGSKAPPRTPSKETQHVESGDEITGNDIASIWRSAKAAAEKSGTL